MLRTPVMDNEQITQRFSELEKKASDVAHTLHGDHNDVVSSEKFKEWATSVSGLLQLAFGENSIHYRNFYEHYQIFRGYDYEFEDCRGIFLAAKEDYESGYLVTSKSEQDSLGVIELICEKFHSVARQLRSRYNDRPPLDVQDEYDVQDLIHALLRLFFDDIRPEEWTPSYAGGCSRMDFLLKNEEIVIEIKKTRKGLDAGKLGEQLIVDIARYQAHPSCKTLICFVYDPEGRIANPRGVESDLSGYKEQLAVEVFIRPD
jgi:hypothetical protein